MGRILGATVLLVLAMGGITDGYGNAWFWLSPFLTMLAVALIVDAARARR